MSLHSQRPLVWKATEPIVQPEVLPVGKRPGHLLTMLKLVNLPRRARVIDLGGTETPWRLIRHHFHVTIVNPSLDHSHVRGADAKRYSFLREDVCDLTQRFGDGEFDLVFSDSCIEHLNTDRRQEMMAREARRLGKAYWVHVPSRKSFIEAHTGMPLYWHWPHWMKGRLRRRLQMTDPKTLDLIDSSRPLSRERLWKLFPDAQMYVERTLVGTEKSYAAYRVYATEEEIAAKKI